MCLVLVWAAALWATLVLCGTGQIPGAHLGNMESLRLTMLDEVAAFGAHRWVDRSALFELASQGDREIVADCRVARGLLHQAAAGALNELSESWHAFAELMQEIFHNATIHARVPRTELFLGAATRVSVLTLAALNFFSAVCMLARPCCALLIDTVMGVSSLKASVVAAERLTLGLRLLWWGALSGGGGAVSPVTIESRYLAEVMTAKGDGGDAPFWGTPPSTSAHNESTVFRVASAERSVVIRLHNDAVEAVDGIQNMLLAASSQDEGVSSGWYPPHKSAFYETFDLRLVDKGILQYLLRQVFQKGDTVADLGALNGAYAAWLNETGLVSAIAFDGTPGIEIITQGRVRQLDLTRPNTYIGKFDWGLVIEVAEHIHQSHQGSFLINLAQCCQNLVLSWAPPGQGGHGHVNERLDEDVKALLESNGFTRDEEATVGVRKASAVWYIGHSVAVYRQRQNRNHVTPIT